MTDEILDRPHRLGCPWHGEDIDDLEDSDCECE